MLEIDFLFTKETSHKQVAGMQVNGQGHKETTQKSDFFSLITEYMSI